MMNNLEMKNPFYVSFGKEVTLLPYYKIQKIEEDERFYFSHEGYFNFWDEFLICNLNKVNWVIVNRVGRKFGKVIVTKEQRLSFNTVFEKSVREKIPEEMFTDFPELEYLKIE